MSFATISLSYVYADPKIWERYKIACDASGWPKAIMLTQIVHTFGAVELEYYQKAAELDALARGFKQHQGEHFRILRDWKDLPPYVGVRPDYKRSLLEGIAEPDRSWPRESYSRFKCSPRNAAILKLAVEIERSNIPTVMTKLMYWYYTRYWDGRYTLQIAAAEQETINPTLDK